jgi:hypothetical protein
LRTDDRSRYEAGVSFFGKWLSRSANGSELALLQRCRGDEAQLERLIALEMTKRPGMSRDASAKAALDRWSRDR